MQMQEFQTNAKSQFSQSGGYNYCQPKQLSPYYRYDRVPFKSQDVFDTKHIPRADGAKRRARVLISPGYLHPGKRKH